MSDSPKRPRKIIVPNMKTLPPKDALEEIVKVGLNQIKQQVGAGELGKENREFFNSLMKGYQILYSNPTKEEKDDTETITMSTDSLIEMLARAGEEKTND